MKEKIIKQETTGTPGKRRRSVPGWIDRRLFFSSSTQSKKKTRCQTIKLWRLSPTHPPLSFVMTFDRWEKKEEEETAPPFAFSGSFHPLFVGYHRPPSKKWIAALINDTMEHRTETQEPKRRGSTGSSHFTLLLLLRAKRRTGNWSDPGGWHALAN